MMRYRSSSRPFPGPRAAGRALALVLAALAAPLAARGGQDAAPAAENVDPPAEDVRVERRVQVVFTDGESVSEERVWVDHGDGEHPIFLGGDGEMMIHAAPGLRPRTYLGVHLLDITPELRQHFGAAADSGVLVSAVAADGPAAAAGIAVGDVLLTIDGEEVARAAQVLRQLVGREEGEAVTVGLVRDRRSLSLEATLAARPRQQIDLAPMFWTPGDGDRHVLRLPNRILEIEKGDLNEAFSELHDWLGSPEWREKIEETDSRRVTLEIRIRELEERLHEMEKRLEETPPN